MATAEITRPCKYCGDQVTSTDLTYEVCRACHYSGRVHADQFAPLIADLDALAPAGTVAAYPEHTGGGCWWLAVRMASGGYFAGTLAYKNDDGEWETDATLPDNPNGPWSIGYYQDADDCEGINVACGVSGEVFVEIVRRGEVAKLGQHVRFRKAVERFPHCLAEAGTTGRVAAVCDGFITVELDAHVPSLAEWDNCVLFDRDMETYEEFFEVAEVIA